MSRGKWFPGLLLVVIGGMLLASNLGYLDISVGEVLSLWPLLLVLIGISMLLGSRRGMPFGIVALLVLAGVFVWYGEDNNWDIQRMMRVREVSSENTTFHQPLREEVKTASFQLDSGAGNLDLSDGSALEDLFTIDTSSTWGSYSMERQNSEDNRESWRLYQNVRTGNGLFSFGKHHNQANIKLSSQPDWQIRANVGAANVSFDLTNLTVSEFRIESGASTMNIRIGEKQEHSDVTIKTGASTLTVYVPRASNVRLQEDTGLSSHDFQDFVKTGDKTYVSSGTEQAENTVDLKINAGVSSIKVIRY